MPARALSASPELPYHPVSITYSWSDLRRSLLAMTPLSAWWGDYRTLVSVPHGIESESMAPVASFADSYMHDEPERESGRGQADSRLAGLMYQCEPKYPEALLEFEMVREANHDIRRSCNT